MRKRSLLLRYGAAVLATVLATVLRKLLDPVLEDTAPFLGVFRGHHVYRLVWRAGPSVAGPRFRRLLASYLFIEPRGSLVIHDLEHQVSLGLYLVVGVVVALLSESLHANRRRTEAGACRTGGR